jgi:hypothetical protein
MWARRRNDAGALSRQCPQWVESRRCSIDAFGRKAALGWVFVHAALIGALARRSVLIRDV